jgi:hypothetical protein
MSTRISLATWPADYGSPVGDDGVTETATVVQTDIEVPDAAWAPRAVDTPPAPVVWFVDGVRRMESWAWLTADDGRTTRGLFASWAAGAIRCDGAAVIEQCEVQRGLFSARKGAPGLLAGSSGGIVFAPRDAQADTDAGLRNALQAAMRATEFDIAREVGEPDDLVFLDGPVRGRTHPRTVGYIKTQQVSYLTEALRLTVEKLAVGQRTPLFLTKSQNWQHWSWYLRLSDHGDHPWESVVRCEAPKEGVDLPAAIVLADEATATLPRYASQPHRDVRAPQNLYPIGGLERCLQHRLGSAAVIARHLRRAVSVVQ